MAEINDPAPGGYMAPLGVSIAANMANASTQANPSQALDSYNWFYNQVKNNATGSNPNSWDYKQLGTEYEGFGNFNYGATGAAMGIPEWLLLRAAGAASITAQPSRVSIWGLPFGPAPYGDDPKDQQAIRDGIEYARQNGYSNPPPLFTPEGIQGDPFTGMPWSGVDPSVDTGYKSAQNYVIPRRDPLVLDLDGDGLELIAANGTVLFDHNADGIKTGTGWAAPHDGLLVRDLNGNGFIDSGRELFGIDTIKSNNSFATQGFDALKDLDSNLDGFITSADTAFTQLQVWQDLNQDGISQAGELKTLSQWGITSISVNGSTTGPQAGQVLNGNRVDLSASFTQNGASRTVGSVDFQVNNFFAEFPAQLVDEAGNPVAISEQARALPQMNGSGMVRNMQVAASLSGEFVGASAKFVFAKTSIEKLARGATLPFSPVPAILAAKLRRAISSNMKVPDLPAGFTALRMPQVTSKRCARRFSLRVVRHVPLCVA